MSYPNVSVIVPAYNAEHSLGTCLKSLARQTEASMEVLVIDDGSTDSTPDIIAGWVQEDSRIRSRRIPNSGLSEARNSGLAMARGRYVMFLDSDDWCESRTLEDLCQAALVSGSEVVVAGAVVDHVDAHGKLTSRISNTPPNAAIDEQTTIGHLPRTQTFVNLLGFAWNKLYDRHFLERHHIRFTNALPGYEDIQFNALVFELSAHIKFIDVAHVHYVQHHGDRLSKTFRPDSLGGRLKDGRALELVLKRLHWSGEERLDIHRELMSSALTRFIWELSHAPGYNRGQMVCVLQTSRDQETRSVFKSLLFGRSAGLKYRLTYLLFMVAPARISILFARVAYECPVFRRLVHQYRKR